MRYDRPKVKNDFTDEEIDLIMSAASTEWQYVGADCFGEGMPRSMSRNQAIEVSIDAGRIEQRLDRLKDHPELSAKYRKFADSVDYKSLLKFFHPAFGYARYSA